MKQNTKQILASLVKEADKKVSMRQISDRMNEKRVHLDNEVKKIEQLDMKAQVLSMTYYVR